MPPQYFERSAANSVVGSPLTPRRLNEVRAESGGLGKGELFFKHNVFITPPPCPAFTDLNGIQEGSCSNGECTIMHKLGTCKWYFYCNLHS